eukprot:TRINITY_DN1768_c0_g2_i1.p1 TRINITY_DN1768_c0_g2~~TRINITY_DN1768_c0_g2_i1.p1  ORF type:complete len:371 (-),score=45.16 TRINITY_DN1768_c0_g2_i1:284-1396(-)
MEIEDLRKSIFLQEIIRKSSDLLLEAHEKKWVICVPNSNSISSKVTQTDIRDHVLCPTSERDVFRTLNDCTVHFEKNCLQTGVGFDKSRKIPIVHDQRSKKNPRILQLAGPLRGGSITSSVADISKSTIHKYIAFLKSYPEHSSLFKSLRSFLKQIKRHCHEGYLSCVYTLINQKCDEVVALLMDTTFSDDSITSESRQESQLRVVIQAYMLDHVYEDLYSWVKASKKEEIRILGECLVGVNSKKINFTKFPIPLPGAVKQLQKIHLQKTPLEKLATINLITQLVGEGIQTQNKSTKIMTAGADFATDDLLEGLTTVLVDSYPQSAFLCVDLDIIEKLCIPDSFGSVNDFNLANIQVAVNYMLELHRCIE